MNRRERRAAAKQPGVKVAEPARQPAPAPDPTFQRALQHHQAGRLAEAERLYRDMLQH